MPSLLLALLGCAPSEELQKAFPEGTPITKETTVCVGEGENKSCYTTSERGVITFTDSDCHTQQIRGVFSGEERYIECFTPPPVKNAEIEK